MRPGTGRDLATELIQFVDPRGALRQGVGLEVAPWMFVPGLSIALADYQTRPGRFILANTAVSLASVRVGGDTGGTELGVGIRSVLINRADPMTDPGFTSRLRQGLLTCLPDQPDTPEEDIRSCHREVRAAALEAFLAERWNGAALAVGAGTGRSAPASLFDGTDPLGWAVWVSGAVPLGRHAQFAVQGRLQDRDVAPGLRTRLVDVGGKLTVGGAAGSGYVELGGRRVLDGEGEAGPLRWAAGLEFRAGSGWITLGLGEGPEGAQRGPPAFLTGLRWDLSDRPRLVPDPAVR